MDRHSQLGTITLFGMWPKNYITTESTEVATGVQCVKYNAIECKDAFKIT